MKMKTMKIILTNWAMEKLKAKPESVKEIAKFVIVFIHAVKAF